MFLGCRFQHGTLLFRCTAPGGVEVLSEEWVNCAKVDQALTLAAAKMQAFGIASESDADRATRSVRITVSALYEFPASDGLGERWGEYAPASDEIMTNRVGVSLLHECLHRLDIQRGTPGSGLHLGWAERRYFEADAEFYREFPYINLPD